MTDAISIRPYCPDDEAGVTALWRRVFAGEDGRNAPAAIIARKGEIQPELFFVAIDNGQVVGTVLAGYDGVRGWVHKLAVHPDWRRRGIASDLMRWAERGLAAIDCPKLNLQVRSTNPGVVKFYQAHGYAVEDRISLGKRLDD